MARRALHKPRKSITGLLKKASRVSLLEARALCLALPTQAESLITPRSPRIKSPLGNSCHESEQTVTFSFARPYRALPLRRHTLKMSRRPHNGRRIQMKPRLSDLTPNIRTLF
ncbi:hypothetical protein CKAH01_03484 [Colletotrichum kahawae]|uniref:Uncharacterized protein n=1 Tax=Colletotrichum kahawae TaxID=34407 RepID=A0AAD9YQU0_COLKA|nr:hypothetical protein CKAH01_03484 [Colletotrichum kahawae]